jgi:ribosomal-protein-alanine N-acetyltransferase
MIGAYDIELARPRDAEAIAALAREEIETGLGWGWRPGRVQRAIADRATNVVVARTGEALAGFGIMSYHEQEAHLNLFGVDRAHRRRGVGRALIEWLESSARTAGIEFVFLEARLSNRLGRAFYEALGYRELAPLRRYYAAREDGVRIGKDLVAAP